jgi:hypothetical protein
MTYKGTIRNGVVVLQGNVSLPENAEVNVELVGQTGPKQPPSWAEVFKDVIGSVDDMPSDMAENHDHYIHGTEKK